MKSEYFDAIPENKIKVGLRWYDKYAAYQIKSIWYQGYDLEQTSFGFQNYQEAIDSYKSKYGSDPYENVKISIERMGSNDYRWKYVGCYLGPDIYHQFLECDSVEKFTNL
jgi:hypothetical protein